MALNIMSHKVNANWNQWDTRTNPLGLSEKDLTAANFGD